MIWHSGPDKKHCIAFEVDRIWRFLFLQHKPKETVPCSVAWRDMNDSCLVYYSKCPENWVLFLCNILHLPSVFTKKITNVKMRNIGFSRTGNTRKPLNFFFSSSICLSVCPASYCSVNDPPANGGVINRTRLRPGSKLFYYCNRGHRLVGLSNATCRLHSNGLFQWDTPPPFCQGKYTVCINMKIYLLSTLSYSLIGVPLLKGGSFRIEGFVVGFHKMFYDGRKELTDPESFSDSGKHRTSAFIAVGSVSRLRLYRTRIVYK